MTVDAMEERQKGAVLVDLRMPPLRAEHRSRRIGVQVARIQQRCRAEERRAIRRQRRKRARLEHDRPCLRHPQHPVNGLEVG